MLNVLHAAVRASLVTLVLCGLLYPLALTGLGQLIFPFQANGSLMRDPRGAIVGSRLIGQAWIGPEWFHGRPSATTDRDPKDPTKTVPVPYNAASSAGSNLGPTSRILAARLDEERKNLEAAQPELQGKELPADMLTASGSGLDPDISLANASLQIPRIARARGLSPTEIDALLRESVIARGLGVFGEPRVNVLALNLALQRMCRATGRCAIPSRAE